MSIAKDILDGINLLIDKRFKESGFTKLKTGIVTAVNSNNTYKVTIDGKEWNNVTSLVSVSLNNVVKIIYTEGSASNAIILGVRR